MDTKVVVEVVCPHCQSKVMMKKKVEVSSLTFNCPGKGCGKKLYVVFDVTKDPQTYEVVDESGENAKKKEDETVYKKVNNSEEEIDNGAQKKKTVYGKNKHNTSHNIYNDLDDDDDEVKPKKRHRLRERIYLTHITWFGLKNQRFQLCEGTTTIGRYDEDDTSDIMIRGDDTMSRKSVAIIIEEEDGVFEYKLKVLNALNKVKVNDQRVKEGAEVYLDFGDIIMLGNSKFKFDNH